MGINEKDLRQAPISFSFTTRVRIGEFEGDLEVTAASFNDLRKTVNRLLPEAGIDPIRVATSWQTTPTGDPICPKHGMVMRKRERQGDVWFSHNVAAEGEPDCYCRGYPGKDSPGWER